MLISLELLALAYSEYGWIQRFHEPTVFENNQWISAHAPFDGLVDVTHALEDIAVWSPSLARNMGDWFVEYLKDRINTLLGDFPPSYELPR